MEAKLKYLEMVQAIVSRMAYNSFLIKGWSLTLTSAFLILASRLPNGYFLLFSFLPILMFWSLDGYFLRQERLFRELYNSLCKKEEYNIDFSMDTRSYDNLVSSWFRTIFSKTLILYHGIIFLAVLLLYIYIAYVGF